MPRLEAIWDERNRPWVLAIAGALTAVIAFLDWWTKPYVSLGFLYLFPIMLAAGLLPRWVVALLGLAGAGLSAVFSSLEMSVIRLLFETLALAGCGLFVGELVRNRRLTLGAQERLRILVETSPAAIVTVNEHGFIEVANRAAAELIAPNGGQLIGNPIAAFLPDLHYAVRKEEGPQFRASMQCRGRRADGEPFLADVWFSTYKDGTAPKLAAIIAAAPEEAVTSAPFLSSNHREMPPLSPREAEVLRGVVQGFSNKEIAARMDISESTVKNTLQQLFAKSEVRTRSQLVRVALEYYRTLL
jgi:PAS domain S-box-containing protein